MKRLLFAALVLFACATVAGVAVAEEGPLADAGLDQSVDAGTTVQLDGTGSAHPDGNITAYEWSIRTPAGRETTPDCANCSRTQFTPSTPGRYEVTVTVTDEQGRTDSDTLYVYVDGVGPTVDLSGPASPDVGEDATFEAAAEADGDELAEITWTVDGEEVATRPLSGRADDDQLTRAFPDTDARTIEVTVRDAAGRTASDRLVVAPRSLDFPDTDVSRDSPDTEAPSVETPTVDVPELNRRNCDYDIQMQGGYNTAHACGVDNRLAVVSTGTSVQVHQHDVGTFGVDIEQTTELTELERQFIHSNIDPSADSGSEGGTDDSTGRFGGGFYGPSGSTGLTASSTNPAGTTSSSSSVSSDSDSTSASSSANSNGSLAA